MQTLVVAASVQIRPFKTMFVLSCNCGGVAVSSFVAGSLFNIAKFLSSGPSSRGELLDTLKESSQLFTAVPLRVKTCQLATSKAIGL